MQIQDDKPYDDINITPMLDLAYVLLVIFILMTTATVQGLKVNLPKASNTPSLAKPKTKAITLNNEGKIFLDTVPVTPPEPEQRLNQQKAQTPDFPVIVRGDSLTQYQGVMDVLDVLGRLGLTQVGLATKKASRRTSSFSFCSSVKASRRCWDGALSRFCPGLQSGCKIFLSVTRARGNRGDETQKVELFNFGCEISVFMLLPSAGIVTL